MWLLFHIFTNIDLPYIFLTSRCGTIDRVFSERSNKRVVITDQEWNDTMKIALSKLDYEVNLISFHFINIWIIIPLNISFKIASLLLFSHSVMSDFSWPHGLQHARLPCPSPSPRACSNSCPLHQWCHPTVSSCHPLLLPSICLSFRVFSNESALLIKWLKYWSYSFSISPSNEYSGLISFRMDWLDLLASQGTLKSSISQFKSISSSVLSLLYGPTLTSIHDYWKNHCFH